MNSKKIPTIKMAYVRVTPKIGEPFTLEGRLKKVKLKLSGICVYDIDGIAYPVGMVKIIDEWEVS